MEVSGQPSGRNRATVPAPAWAGELIVQNGRQSGSRRSLEVPLTFIGKGANCDIRLNVEGMDARHCLLVHGPNGLFIRDLESSTGTFVNGERVIQAELKDGDLLTIGPFQFRLHLPPPNLAMLDRSPERAGDDLPSTERDALRLQAAAVAAQQVALGEEEVRLLQRKVSLERQEEQLASHLEDKRRKLILLNERAQAERQALQQDRLAHEKHLEKITSDMTQAQRELLDKEEKLKNQRKHLGGIFQRMRLRLFNQVKSERARILQYEQNLTQQARNLDQEKSNLLQREQELAQRNLEFQGEYHTGRHQLKAAWQNLRQAQHHWRQRRNKELTVLKQKTVELRAEQQILAEGQRLFQQDKKEWETRRAVITKEIEGLNIRIKNQRHKILEQQLDINRLDNLARLRQPRISECTALVPVTGPQSSLGEIVSCSPAGEPLNVVAVPETWLRNKSFKGKAGRTGRQINQVDGSINIVPGESLVSTSAGSPSEQDILWRELEKELDRRQGELERLAGDLADQRLLLLEHWKILAENQEGWEKDRDEISRGLETLGQRLQQQELELNQREQDFIKTETQLRLRHREMNHLRQQLVAWRARLKIRENSLESERQQLLTDVQNRENLADKHLTGLTDLRQRWARRRHQELEQVRSEKASCNQLRQECVSLRDNLAKQRTKLEEEKRQWTEKALALEQYRQDILARVDDPAMERRLERLRRRWYTQNAALVRATSQARENLQGELAELDLRFAELQKRQEKLGKAEKDLADRQTALEHKQVLVAARNARLEQEHQSAQALRMLLEHQITRMKEEVERIARQLLEEPDPPANLPVDKAA